MKLHEIEISSTSWDQILERNKNFLILENTKDYSEGDLINFVVVVKKIKDQYFNPITNSYEVKYEEIKYPNKLVFQVTFVLKQEEKVTDGYVVVNFVRLEPVK